MSWRSKVDYSIDTCLAKYKLAVMKWLMVVLVSWCHEVIDNGNDDVKAKNYGDNNGGGDDGDYNDGDNCYCFLK